MSRVRYAVRRNGLHGPVTHPYSTKKSAAVSALTQGGKVVRVTQYDAAETEARRNVIEAARMFAANEPLAEAQLEGAVYALEAVERKGASK